jgi:predicted N-formylglutamate amidohydrolase
MTEPLRKTHAPDWPPPVEIRNEAGTSDIVLLCEHASNHIPKEFNQLGLDGTDTKRHIAWDIGAAEVTRRLSAALHAPAFLSSYSRLLIDLNRPLDSESSIPARSESTDIPGNAGLTPEERARRAARIFTPFHDRVAAHVLQREEAGRPARIVAIHSFTPVFFGKARPWHAGILYDTSAAFAQAVIGGLRRDPSLNVEANVPYVISRDEDYAIPIHGQDRGHDAILIEIRQDLISSAEGIEEWVDRLTHALVVSPEGEKR